MNDYLFVKYYRWFERLNRIYRKYGMNWQEDCMELAISNLSFLQGLQTSAMVFILLGQFVSGKVINHFANENVEYVFIAMVILLPFIVYHKLNRKRYITKEYYKKVLADTRWKKKSGIWSVFYIVITLILIFISALCMKSVYK